MSVRTMTLEEIIRHGRCTICRASVANDQGVNAVMRAGVLTGLVCSGCQTPQENAQAVINEATTTYTQDAFGRATGSAKTS